MPDSFQQQAISSDMCNESLSYGNHVPPIINYAGKISEDEIVLETESFLVTERLIWLVILHASRGTRM